MRNHHEKNRDMARSVLPSTRRQRARTMRTDLHGRERVRERRLLHDLRRCVDLDDFEGELGVTACHRADLDFMVWLRRFADKVGPLRTWAERLVERDPALAAATPEDRAVHFRSILPPGLIGDHAIGHLYRVLHDRPGSGG